MLETRPAEPGREDGGILVVPGRLGVDEHAEPRRARGGLGMHEIRVNQRVTAVGRRLRLLRRFEGIEHGIDPRVPRHVGDDLPAVPVGDGHRGGDLVRCEGEKSAIRGIVDGVQLARARPVRLAHERRPDQDATVHHDLQRADLQPLVAAAEPYRKGRDPPLDGGGILRVRNPDRDRRA